jgi:flagellar P-ring protein precursor FlgI
MDKRIKMPGTKKTVWIVSCMAVLAWFFFAGISPVHAVRVKDLAAIKGIRTNQLIGYGLVVGLNGTGDKSGSEFTMQSLANMMEHMGINVSKNQLKAKNAAAVMVTANMPPFSRIGSRIDITASSIGDAKSLAGGTLLLTPLHGVNGMVYALAQGPIALGGAGGEGTTKNHLLVARIDGGATVEREVPLELDGRDSLTITLYQPDFTTSTRMAEAINRKVGEAVARPLDSGTLKVAIPSKKQESVSRFIADIESLDVSPDRTAKVVVNEKTGTVVIGENVTVSTVAIAHGNLTITIGDKTTVSQPEAFSQGDTAITSEKEVTINEEGNRILMLPGSSTIGELVRALNAIGVTPRELISIFQNIKASGALQAELEII